MAGCNEAAMRQAMLERSVLASVIAGDVLPSQLGLQAEHFTDGLTQSLFALTKKMEGERRAIDLTNVCMADETIDPGTVVELAQEKCVSEVIIKQNCAMLRETRLRRRLDTLLIAARDALARGEGAAKTLDHLQQTLERLMKSGTGQEPIGKTMLELICGVFDQMEHREDAAAPIACGIEMLDKALNGGFRCGDLAVVAALTSVGKSAMLSFMMRNAAEQGRKILLISCEMSEEQNAERFLASISGVDVGRFTRREALSEAEHLRISDGMERYRPQNIRVISSGTQTVESVRRAALAMKMTEGLDMIVVDYLQRMKSSGQRGSRAEETGAIAAGLKSLAVDLNVPVLTAAQFNREAARARSEAIGQENAGVPALHQLRDSSQIEDEANTVIVLDEPRRYPFATVRRINAYVSKNRCGDLGAVRLLFDPRTMTYAPAPPEEEEF